MQVLRILLLEDMRLDAELLIERCAAAQPGWAIHWVTNEADYLAALGAGGFELILSDHQLPGFSGMEALEAARRLVPEVPFIFVSGVIGEENAVEMLKRGATDYVSKGRLARLPVVVERALREVAERRQRLAAEHQLRESDALYSRLVESLREHAVFLLDASGAVRSCNPAAESIFGVQAAGLVGRSAACLFTAEDQAEGVFEAELERSRTQGRAVAGRWLARHDGSRLWGDYVITPLFDAQGAPSGFSALVRDGTSAHESAVLLRAAKEEAERANTAKDRFLAVLSHELRTPLMPIAAAAQLLERRVEVPPECATLLPMIRRNVALEARLIDDLLDLTSIRQGKLQLQWSTVDLHDVVRTAVEMLEADAARKGIVLAADLQARHRVVRGDAARLLQIVWNVVRNAVKFTPPEGSVRLASADAPDGELALTCTDSGIGIKPDALSRIFVPFEQADEEVARTYGGLGLGLAIASHLAQQHGGRLTAASEGTGRGATFTLWLPAEAVQPEPADAAAVPGQPAGSALRLLLVEDNTDAAESLRLALQNLGCAVVVARTLAAGIEAAERGGFDAIVTDLGLPDGHGIEMGRRFGAHLPVVALSGFGSENDVQASRASGFAEHLAKPIDPEVLYRAIEQLVLRRRA